MPVPPVDWTDPCARAAALRDAYFNIVKGGSVSLIRTRAAGGEREVRFQKGEQALLRTELWAAEDECRASLGQPKLQRRFSITAGSRRRW
jgi:hypothetical protein